mmetsp:Transcript_12875/g.30542  ORF Transcript_12875/g.30542 Transcript_12875/m.30542 type:complete len:168 (+) Transcript_12875:113-616(+)
MSYFRSGYGKRRYRDDADYFQCDCGEECHDDEGCTCGCCESIHCEACTNTLCDICDDRERRTGEPNEVGTAAICESCISYPGCDACGSDVTICKGCIQEHLKTCSKKTRSERVIASADLEISFCETSIRKLRQEIESKQSKLRQVEAKLAAAQARKSAAGSDTKSGD